MVSVALTNIKTKVAPQFDGFTSSSAAFFSCLDNRQKKCRALSTRPGACLIAPNAACVAKNNNMAEEEADSLDALEYELNQMGLSVEDLQPPEDGRYDRRAMARVESARIMSRRFIERDRLKDKIITRTKVRTTTGCCMFLLTSAYMVL